MISFYINMIQLYTVNLKQMSPLTRLKNALEFESKWEPPKIKSVQLVTN